MDSQFCVSLNARLLILLNSSAFTFTQKDMTSQPSFMRSQQLLRAMPQTQNLMNNNSKPLNGVKRVFTRASVCPKVGTISYCCRLGACGRCLSDIRISYKQL